MAAPNANQDKLIKSTEAINSSKVEFRNRALSTGANFANNQAYRQTARLAKGNRAELDELNHCESIENRGLEESERNNDTSFHKTGEAADNNALTRPILTSNIHFSRLSESNLQQRDSSIPPDAYNCKSGQDKDRVVGTREQEAIQLLNKSSFNCTLVGSRQTGKRTIVKCFVKILNEFKIAVDEYKKDQMINKLMDCSEKLQEIANQQEEQQKYNHNNSMQRSRINSWFGGISMNKIIGSGNNNIKRRLHSTVGISLREPEHQQTQHQRRNTTIVQTVRHDQANNNDDEIPFRFNGCLSPGDGRNQVGRLLNKSDTNINYKEENNETIAMTQLNVPVPIQRKTSEPGSIARESQSHLEVNKSFEDSQTSRRKASVRMRLRRRRMISLKELNRRRCKIKFKTRRHLSDRLLIGGVKSNDHRETEHEFNESYGTKYNFPDSFFVVYSINDRVSFEYAKTIVFKLYDLRKDSITPIVLVANKIDLERAKVVKSEEGRALARKYRCKFIEISCTVGFNLDNLLVGLRTQLILKHHRELNTIIRNDKSNGPKSDRPPTIEGKKSEAKDKLKSNDNILVRFYKRYVMDNQEQNYDCDNFSKL